VTTLQVHLDRRRAVFRDPDSGAEYTVPLGSAGLAEMIVGDPPLPEELTNAIGLFVDHMEDVTREGPSAEFADTIAVHGPGLQALVDTEAGLSRALPVELTRAELEDVFRTLATEATADRLLNPGLPADDVHHVLGVCCALVALVRALQAPGLLAVSA
jgi:exopolyphosphatase / guanosine-5'-triphosphate,3'-diphosphate pyrophosphatase